MNQKSKLNIPFDVYMAKMVQLITEGSSLLSKEIKSTDAFNKYVKEIEMWLAETENFFINSFTHEYTNLLNRFGSLSNRVISIPRFRQRAFEDEHLMLKETFRPCVQFLDTHTKLIAVMPNVRETDKEWVEIKDMPTAEKIELILHKLSLLYGDEYYPIAEILNGEGVVVKKKDEYEELAGMIVEKGYAQQQPNSLAKTFLRLTAKGLNYVEEKEKRINSSTEYEKINSSLEELNKKIDSVIEDLKMKGYGQEILFEELEDLKEQAPKLNQKQFGQLLKGKLIDLGLSQVINMDVVNHIYKEFTEHVLRLPVK